jgi:hypothetical protein
MVSLNADLLLPNDAPLRNGWALQLWACDHPYEGGMLQGVKVAEIPVTLSAPTLGTTVRLEAETVAHMPLARREFAMILVLAARESDTVEQVEDFANYPSPHLFQVPYFEGTVGYSFEGETVLLTVDGVYNPRPWESLSGSMALELWALASPLSNEPLEGVLLARAEVGQVSGQRMVGPLHYSVPVSWPPAGRWWLALLLREWTAAGLLTRDSRNFSVPFDSGGASREMPAAPVVPRDDEPYAQPALLGLSPLPLPSRDEIAFAAYHRYLARGCAPGHDLEDWLEAERELLRALALA